MIRCWPLPLQAYSMQEMDSPKLYLQSLSIEVKRTVQLHHNLPESLHLNQVGLASLPKILFVDLRHKVSLSLPLRMWRCFNWHWRKFQLSKSPCVLPPKLAVCVGDSGPAPLPGPDSCLLFDRGGTLSLPVWLGGGAGADRADFCGHQVSDHETYLLMNIIHTSIFPQATFLYTIRVGALCCFTKLLIDGAKSPCIIGKRFHVLKGFWKFCMYQHVDLFAHIPGQCCNLIH